MRQTFVNIFNKYTELENLLLKRQSLRAELQQVNDDIDEIKTQLKTIFNSVDLITIQEEIDNIP